MCWSDMNSESVNRQLEWIFVSSGFRQGVNFPHSLSACVNAVVWNHVTLSHGWTFGFEYWWWEFNIFLNPYKSWKYCLFVLLCILVSKTGFLLMLLVDIMKVFETLTFKVGNYDIEWDNAKYFSTLELYCFCTNSNVGGLAQDCSISSALALEILQYCIKPLICFRTE